MGWRGWTRGGKGSCKGRLESSRFLLLPLDQQWELVLSLQESAGERNPLLQASTGNERALEGSLEPPRPPTPTNPKVLALEAISESDFCAAQINPAWTTGQVGFWGTEGLDPRYTISTQKCTQHATPTQGIPQNFPNVAFFSFFPSCLETHNCNSNQERTLSTCYPKGWQPG